MIRRLDVPGGMAKRQLSGPRYAKRVFTFLHNIVGHYFPLRFAAALSGVHLLRRVSTASSGSAATARSTRRSRRADLGDERASILSIVPLWFFWLGAVACKRSGRRASAHAPHARPLPIRCRSCRSVVHAACRSSRACEPTAAALPSAVARSVDRAAACRPGSARSRTASRRPRGGTPSRSPSGAARRGCPSCRPRSSPRRTRSRRVHPLAIAVLEVRALAVGVERRRSRPAHSVSMFSSSVSGSAGIGGPGLTGGSADDVLAEPADQPN